MMLEKGLRTPNGKKKIHLMHSLEPEFYQEFL